MADAGKKAEEKPAEVPKQADASLEDLLEDDEFEEFETEEWKEKDTVPEDAKQWEDDWDDEDVSDDFSNQLRAELDKASQPAPMAQ